MEKSTRYYGSDMTIHSGGEVNVELDKHGVVVAVWFRCQPLRFTASFADDNRTREMTLMYLQQTPPPLEGVVLKDVDGL